MKSKSIAITGLFLAVCLLFSACYGSVTRDKPIGDTDKAMRVLIYTVDRGDWDEAILLFLPQKGA